MNKRIYLDYNSTSPVRETLWSDLSKLPVENPSSTHLAGKKALKEVHSVTQFLFQTFGISSNEHSIFYHSGASEGLNTIFQLAHKDAFFYFETDHPCIHAIAKNLRVKNVECFCLGVKEDGLPDLDLVIQKINSIKAKNKWINFTYLNNESGIITPIKNILKIKNATNINVHIDAVQIVGKAPNVELSPLVDAYTFSGHKFGALKGIGFSFYKSNLKLNALILGGGQQNGLRGGTLNTHGIYSLKLALNNRDFEKEYQMIKSLKDEAVEIINAYDDLIYIENSSSNTIYFLHKNLKSDVLLVYFDMNGIDVSSGSACSSGSVEKSRVLEAMGYTDLAKNNIRISFGIENYFEKDLILEKLKKVLALICKK